MENPFEQSKSLALVISNPTKTDIKSLAAITIAQIKQSDESYLDKYIQAKAMEEVVKIIIDGIKDDARGEAEKLGKEEKYLGCAVSVKNLPDKYSFEENEEWVKLKAQTETIAKRIKEIEKEMIQAVGFANMVTTDGEVIIPAKLVSYGGTTLAITIGK